MTVAAMLMMTTLSAATVAITIVMRKQNLSTGAITRKLGSFSNDDGDGKKNVTLK